MANAPPTTRTTLLFVRHGAYRGDATDPDEPEERLTARGREQMRTVAETLGDLEIDALYCSDMPRSVESAQVLHEASPELGDPVVDHRIRERAFPAAEPFRTDELSTYRENEKLTDDELRANIEELWRDYFQTGEASRTEVFVAHGNLIRVLAVRALDLPIPRWLSLPVCHNASLTEFCIWEGRRALVAYNDRHRLGRISVTT